MVPPNSTLTIAARKAHEEALRMMETGGSHRDHLPEEPSPNQNRQVYMLLTSVLATFFSALSVMVELTPRAWTQPQLARCGIVMEKLYEVVWNLDNHIHGRQIRSYRTTRHGGSVMSQGSTILDGLLERILPFYNRIWNTQVNASTDTDAMRHAYFLLSHTLYSMDITLASISVSHGTTHDAFLLLTRFMTIYRVFVMNLFEGYMVTMYRHAPVHILGKHVKVAPS